MVLSFLWLGLNVLSLLSVYNSSLQTDDINEKILTIKNVNVWIIRR